MTALRTVEDLLHEARAAHARRDWRAAYEGYARADGVGPMGLDDLDAYATAAWRLGEIRDSIRLSERVYGQLVRRDPAAASMKAVEIGLEWLTRGDVTIANGWMNRARRLLADAPPGPTHGYLAYLDALAASANQDTGELNRLAAHMSVICEPLDDPSLTALCLITRAISAMHDGRASDGNDLLDEAILTLLTGDVRVEWAGDIYCVVLNLCHKLADQPRMRTWTDAMARWCDVDGSAAYYRVCDVHRLQLAAADDDYRQLENHLIVASAALEGVNAWVGAEGFYQLGEVRRLRGDTEGALVAFTKARSLGIDPQPGEALLQCRLGDTEAAWVGLRVAMAGAGTFERMRMLRPAVEIALARDALDEAEQHCRDLEAGAATFATPGYRAWAAHARGAVLVRRGEHEGALQSLETALRAYRTQRSRYETAEVYEWMALAHSGIGADAAAAADLATADTIYEQLAVQPAGTCGRQSPGGLTRREIEVLRVIAGGATNRQVAAQLHLSDKTVGRHLANIYAKLGVSTRTAAAHWAHQQGVLAGDG
ncbi:LuxR C-terminal-related transcriptional regulator [Mycobacterium adipatum]|jgi:DNA-binding NarL/FixJ family response regulator|uniref:helix-turn-helix transcriptional regulator n=1 Tax=Mycobacterium adipatum TaxID=1682113 RepID=UPI0034E0E07C